MIITRREKLSAVLLGVLLIWFVLHRRDVHKDVQTASKVLSPGVVEKIVINPTTRQFEVITPTRDEKLVLPDRPSSIEFSNKGVVTVTSPQWGTELKPFMGFIQSDAFRLGAGLDLFYFKKFDLGLGFGAQVGAHTPVAYVKTSYNVWSGIQVGLTFDNNTHVGLGVTVRL